MTALPSTAVITSPACRPASAAGLPAFTDTTAAPAPPGALALLTPRNASVLELVPDGSSLPRPFLRPFSSSLPSLFNRPSTRSLPVPDFPPRMSLARLPSAPVISSTLMSPTGSSPLTVWWAASARLVGPSSTEDWPTKYAPTTSPITTTAAAAQIQPFGDDDEVDGSLVPSEGGGVRASGAVWADVGSAGAGAAAGVDAGSVFSME